MIPPELLYIDKKQIKFKMDYCCYIQNASVQFPLSKASIWLCEWLIIFYFTTPIQTDKSSKASLWFIAISDQQHFVVPQVQTFRSKTHHTTYTGWHHSLSMAMVKKNVTFGHLLFQHSLHSPINTVLTSPSFESTVIYH